MSDSAKKLFTYLGNMLALLGAIPLGYSPDQALPADATVVSQSPDTKYYVPALQIAEQQVERTVIPRGQGVLAAQYIQAQHSAKCLHLPGGNPNNGIQITQWDCLAQDNIRWEISSVGNGLYQIKSKQTNKCVYVDGGSSQNGAKIVQWDCVNQANGRWRLVKNNDGYSHIVNAQSGKCLHVNGAGNENNVAITQWDCIQQGNVKWKLTGNPGANSPVPESTPKPPANQPSQGQSYRVKMWFTIDNANDGAFDNTIELYGEVRIDGELYWQIPRTEADNNQREAGQTLDVSDSRYIRRQFIFNQPKIQYQVSLRDADSGSSDDDTYIGNLQNLNLERLAGRGELIFPFHNSRTKEASRLHIRVERM